MPSFFHQRSTDVKMFQPGPLNFSKKKCFEKCIKKKKKQLVKTIFANISTLTVLQVALVKVTVTSALSQVIESLSHDVTDTGRRDP